MLQGKNERQSSAVEEGGRAGRSLWGGSIAESRAHLFSLAAGKSLSKCVLQGCPEQLSLSQAAVKQHQISNIEVVAWQG